MINLEEVKVFHGLKWNPFGTDVPVKSLKPSASMGSFFYRVENLVMDGGFALITGPSGMGKSVTMRMLTQHLEEITELQVALLTRPQSGLGDFYREIGTLFGIEMKANNRWGGYSSLRKKWLHHTKSTLLKPVLLIDEAQEIPDQVLIELRLLTSENFDSNTMLTVVLGGDGRLNDRLQSPQLHPLATRIKTRHQLSIWSVPDLMQLLEHNLEEAGNPKLITSSAMKLIAEHASGSPRRMNYLANELLLFATEHKSKTIDEQMFLTLFSQAMPIRQKGKKA